MRRSAGTFAPQMAMDTSRRNQSADTIRLDAEGNWYQGEYPILHDRTCNYLHKHIERDEDGNYYLTGEEKPVYIAVEDVPFWIVKIERTIAGYLITLTDESIELLEPETLWVGPKDALYCLVKGGGVPAKFQRNSYHELAKNIESRGEDFVLAVGSKKYVIGKTPLISMEPVKLLSRKEKRDKQVKARALQSQQDQAAEKKASKSTPKPAVKAAPLKTAKKVEVKKVQKSAPKKEVKKVSAPVKKPSKTSSKSIKKATTKPSAQKNTKVAKKTSKNSKASKKKR